MTGMKENLLVDVVRYGSSLFQVRGATLGYIHLLPSALATPRRFHQLPSPNTRENLNRSTAYINARLLILYASMLT